MANEKLIVTTSDGTAIPVVMAPPGHGAGVSFIIPSLLTGQESQAVTDVMAEPHDNTWTRGGQAKSSDVEAAMAKFLDSEAPKQNQPK